jgi:hypothetical protein
MLSLLFSFFKHGRPVKGNMLLAPVARMQVPDWPDRIVALHASFPFLTQYIKTGNIFPDKVLWSSSLMEEFIFW